MQFNRKISLLPPCLTSLAFNILPCQDHLSYSFLLSACAMQCGTKGIDELRTGARNGDMSVCAGHHGSERQRKVSQE